MKSQENLSLFFGSIQWVGQIFGQCRPNFPPVLSENKIITVIIIFYYTVEFFKVTKLTITKQTKENIWSEESTKQQVIVVVPHLLNFFSKHFQLHYMLCIFSVSVTPCTAFRFSGAKLKHFFRDLETLYIYTF